MPFAFISGEQDEFSQAPHRGAISLLFLAVIGCGGGEEPQVDRTPSTAIGQTSSSAVQANIDRLRALGYADVSDDVTDEAVSGVLHHVPQLAQPGYNLYSNRYACSAILMDNAGRELRRWERPTHRAWSNVQVLADGDLLIIGQESNDDSTGTVDERRYLLRLSFAGEERWRADINAHHDVEVTPNGDIAVLSFRRNRESALGSGVVLREDTVVLLDQDGKPLDERSLYEVLNTKPEMFEMHAVASEALGVVKYIDPIHANSVEFLQQPKGAPANELFAAGNVLVSSRHQDAVFIFNWQSGELVWAWGRGEILGPHDATMLDNGHILIFDNGLGRGWSRVIELEPTSGKIVWEYHAKEKESFYTLSRGSSQRLANGNTLMAESDRGRAIEVTREGKIIWAWVNPARDAENRVQSLVRMKRLPRSFIDPFLSKE